MSKSCVCKQKAKNLWKELQQKKCCPSSPNSDDSDGSAVHNHTCKNHREYKANIAKLHAACAVCSPLPRFMKKKKSISKKYRKASKSKRKQRKVKSAKKLKF